MPVELKRGVNVFTLKQLITEPNFYTFTAEFNPGKGSGDRRAINNVAEGFTHARGTAQVLLIEGTRGEHNELVKALREKKMEVTVLAAPKVGGGGDEGGDALPVDLAQLQPYDTVILGNVSKDALTEAQQTLLESNVHDMGAGLVMLGGPDSFGAGGWMNTPVEKALPVDMQIKALRVQGKGALVLIMHASEIAEGNYWQKVVAQEAIKTMSSYDYAGMLHWEGSEAWLFSLQAIGGGKNRMLRAIDRMTPGDMPAFDPSLQMSARALGKLTDAMTRHIIVISDGDPSPPTAQTINLLRANKVTVTAVLTAAHGNDQGATFVMRDLATKTKGRFYNVTNNKALPRIYQKEARIISRPLIFEQKPPWRPTLAFTSEPVTGLPQQLPPISGYVLTSPKESELVEIPITSPLPGGQLNPILAHWTYGLGRSVAFTSDAGRRWATSWPDWENYAAFWSQVIRWSMRPVDRGNLTLSVRREQGRIKVVVDALDKENQFLNFLQFQGNIVSPSLKRGTVELAQTAPGRYEATIEEADASGNYFVNLGYRGSDGVQGVISSGVSVPYSDEYRELKSNAPNLETLASLTDGEVLSWKFRKDGSVDVPLTLGGTNAFRRDGVEMPRAFQDLWPALLWWSLIVFLADVAVRRIAPDIDRIRKFAGDQYQRIRGEKVQPSTEYMEKLKGRKAEVGEQIERSRSTNRFEPQPSAPSGEPLLGETPLKRGPAEPKPRGPEQKSGMGVDPKSEQPESYTDRLLKAKQKVWEDRAKGDDPPRTPPNP
ncbi:glutamine amidotransferase [Isosphaeraceae bacterium EP7]